MDFLRQAHHDWTNQIDPRGDNLPLVKSSYQVPLLIVAYLYLVFIYGPRFMKNRQPYSLKTFIKWYNIIQIVGNAWLVYDHIDAGLFSNSKLICPVILDYSYNDTPMRLVKCAWYFFLLKILDYVETVVFILRKKNNQVSGLHVYHHITTLLFAWAAVRYYAVAPILLNSLVNSGIHVIMYTYYFLAAWGPEVQKTIAPMKKWITIAQMVQFVVLITYLLQNVLPGCKVESHWKVFLFIGNLMINFYLFYDFYQKTYNKPKRKT
ncbi:elongation of very long chain fatty acids protein AAEL008004-like [Nylanderia fulva]|uniref:elongation of very long chain fatty acids protein AAEL008004-like n=1 Tax=Nylanderia fulva TaxID=613905 RepID=UPI0010FAF80A|nr:elongation of very long chain fatty acids protein AAEL008004-like [Nylanderia fulva]